MIYHVFILVWGDRFVRDFVEISVPFQCMDGNLPSLAQNGEVFYHIYTDRTSLAAFEPNIQALLPHVTLHFHLLEEMLVGEIPLLDWVENLEGPDIKYEIQKRCVLHLTDRALDDPDSEIILLDSNFILSNGTLAAAASHLKAGIKAVNVNFLRVDKESTLPALKANLAKHNSISGRQLVQHALAHPHHLQTAFYVGGENFTPYPSQLCWPVKTAGKSTGILAHAFIPHPLMVKVTSIIKTYQSTMDYDLALRSWPDDDIYMCSDSDEMMVLKYSNNSHHGERENHSEKSAPDLEQDFALFLITSTHLRHRHFGDVSLCYHVDDLDETWQAVEIVADKLLQASYQQIEFIMANAEKLDAKFLMHLKSYTGPIENYSSPALDPIALNKLGEFQSPS